MIPTPGGRLVNWTGNKKCRHFTGGFIVGTLFVYDVECPRLDFFGAGVGLSG